MTGMTTTPHLHIQVDNEDAPFHPYWPFSYSEAADAGLNMYDAVDAGLNQDLILKYSVDPIDFIKNATTIDGPSVAAVSIPNTPTPVAVTPDKTPAIAPVTITNTSVAPGTFRDVPFTQKNYTAISYLTQK